MPWRSVAVEPARWPPPWLRLGAAPTNPTALLGESAVATSLERNGGIILGRNVRVGRAEVDIVALYRGQLVAVEVKSAAVESVAQIEMISRINPRQVARITSVTCRMAQWLSVDQPWTVVAALVTIHPSPIAPTIDWIQDIAEATYSGK
ncbi:MAG: YraN family protein [Planctomycetota bacterium]|nr:YraN family protein [Planctomycetota bacterium]